MNFQCRRCKLFETHFKPTNWTYIISFADSVKHKGWTATVELVTKLIQPPAPVEVKPASSNAVLLQARVLEHHLAKANAQQATDIAVTTMLVFGYFVALRQA